MIASFTACIIPDPPLNGSHVVSDNGTKLTTSCDLGFILTGDRERTCQLGNVGNGDAWLGTAPTCGEYT